MRRALVGATLAALGIVTVTLSAASTHTTTAGTPAPAYALCQEEDGSGPQNFPCFWGGGANGLGETYVLVAPACTPEELQTLSAEQAWRAAHPDAPVNVMPCDDILADL